MTACNDDYGRLRVLGHPVPYDLAGPDQVLELELVDGLVVARRLGLAERGQEGDDGRQQRYERLQDGGGHC